MNFEIETGTVTASSDGVAVVTFSSGFSSIPTVIATAKGTQANSNVNITSLTSTSVTFNTHKNLIISYQAISSKALYAK
jgi:hypothetical protein